MNIKKNFLSRLTRRKGNAQAESEAGYEIPPPAAIKPGVPYTTGNSEEKGFGSHEELELLASGVPAPEAGVPQETEPEAMDEIAQEVKESLIASVTDNAPDEAVLSQDTKPDEGYGDDFEVLAASVSDESADAPEPVHEEGESASLVSESVVEASASEAGMPQEIEPGAMDEIAQEVEEPLARVTDESLQSGAASYEEYGLELESLIELESGASPEEPEPSLDESSLEDEAATSAAANSVVEASAPEPGVIQSSEPDAIDEMVQEVEESLAASITDNAPDEAVLSQDTKPDEGYGDDFEVLAAPVSNESADAPEPEVIQKSEPGAVDDAVAEDEETRTASVLQDSPHADEPPLVDEEADSEIAESAAEAASPEPEISNESEPAEDTMEEVGEPLAAVVMQDTPDEPLEPNLAENGIFPLVQDARGVWRPGKGFSRGELREAGLSLTDASRLHIRFDKRRRNTHPVNVASLEQAKNSVWAA